jgi:amino acid transporter
MELDSGESDQPERLEINNGPKLGAKLSRFDAFALLVGHQIGSGIFAAPSQVHNHTPSPGASLLVWLFSGLIAWSGAASFAELGSIMPVNGGMQEYLHEIYGPFMAFLSSWVWIFAVKPPSMAMLSIIFSQYWIHALLPENLHSLILEKVLAVFMLISMIILNAMGTNTSRRLSAVFFYFKVSAIALLSLCGFLVLMDGLHLGPGNLSLDWKTKNWFSVQAKPDQIDWETANPWDYLGEMSAAITAGLWAFGGWDNVSAASLPLSLNLRSCNRQISLLERSEIHLETYQ